MALLFNLSARKKKHKLSNVSQHTYLKRNKNTNYYENTITSLGSYLKLHLEYTFKTTFTMHN